MFRRLVGAGATLLSCVVCLSASPTQAQELWPASFEFTYAVLGTMTPDLETDSRGVSQGSILGAWRLGDRSRGGPVTALEIGGQGKAGDSSCSPGECVDPDSFTSGALLLGWETADGRLRGLVGPGVARPYGDWENYRLALTARVDGAVPLGSRFAVLLFARSLLVPSYLDQSYTYLTVGAGVRLR